MQIFQLDPYPFYCRLLLVHYVCTNFRTKYFIVNDKIMTTGNSSARKDKKDDGFGSWFSHKIKLSSRHNIIASVVVVVVTKAIYD